MDPTTPTPDGGRPRLLVLEHEPLCPVGRLGDAAAGVGLEIELVDGTSGDKLPHDLAGFAGLAVLGGSMDVSDADDYPFLHDAMRLVRDAAEAEVPALGICLGSQLAATALGGRAYRAPAGSEIGWLPLQRTPAGRSHRVLGALEPGTEVFQWHHDTFEPPPDATVLAMGPQYCQAFALGSVTAVQFHPEVDGDLLELWYGLDPDPAEVERYPLAVALEGAEERTKRVQPMLDAFCELVVAR